MLKWEFLYICELSSTAKKSREIFQKRFMTVKKQLRENENKNEKCSANKELWDAKKKNEREMGEQARELERAVKVYSY